VIGLPKIKTADSAVTGNGASVTRPSSDFSGRGLGTRLGLLRFARSRIKKVQTFW